VATSPPSADRTARMEKNRLCFWACKKGALIKGRVTRKENANAGVCLCGFRVSILGFRVFRVSGF
jgi:hypothetical protein